MTPTRRLHAHHVNVDRILFLVDLPRDCPLPQRMKFPRAPRGTGGAKKTRAGGKTESGLLWKARTTCLASETVAFSDELAMSI